MFIRIKPERLLIIPANTLQAKNYRADYLNLSEAEAFELSKALAQGWLDSICPNTGETMFELITKTLADQVKHEIISWDKFEERSAYKDHLARVEEWATLPGPHETPMCEVDGRNVVDVKEASLAQCLDHSATKYHEKRTAYLIKNKLAEEKRGVAELKRLTHLSTSLLTSEIAGLLTIADFLRDERGATDKSIPIIYPGTVAAAIEKGLILADASVYWQGIKTINLTPTRYRKHCEDLKNEQDRQSKPRIPPVTKAASFFDSSTHTLLFSQDFRSLHKATDPRVKQILSNAQEQLQNLAKQVEEGNGETCLFIAALLGKFQHVMNTSPPAPSEQRRTPPPFTRVLTQ